VPANRTGFAPETTAMKRNERAEHHQKSRKINGRDLYPAAHNVLVAGSSPAGPTNEIRDLSILEFSTPTEIPTESGTISGCVDGTGNGALGADIGFCPLSG
jgi:hypothetical protein